MASGGNEGGSGFQQFPLVPSSVPDDQEMKERIALALNLKDGQQSLGQSVEDPYTRAVKYIEKHRIVEVLQNITARLAYEKPDDPIQYVLDAIAKVKSGENVEELK